MPGSRIGIVICLLFLIGACRAEDSSWQRVQESGVLRVGLDPTYPPFANADGGTLHGFDVDLARAIAADLGVEVEFVLFGYDGLYDALGTRQVDVLISALVVAPERTRDFAYSDTYFDAGEILVIPAAETSIHQMADLNGRILAVELGALGHVEATTWARRLPHLTVQTHADAAAALTAVRDGLADAALVDAISGRLYLAQEPSLRWIPEQVTQEPFAMVVRIEDETLREQLNQSLQNLRAAGQLEAITRRWLDGKNKLSQSPTQMLYTMEAY